MNNDVPKVVVIKLFHGYALFSRDQKIFFGSRVLGFHRLQLQHIGSQASHLSQKLNMCDFVASSQAFVANLGLPVSIGVYMSRGVERYRASC